MLRLDWAAHINMRGNATLDLTSFSKQVKSSLFLHETGKVANALWILLGTLKEERQTSEWESFLLRIESVCER